MSYYLCIAMGYFICYIAMEQRALVKKQEKSIEFWKDKGVGAAYLSLFFILNIVIGGNGCQFQRLCKVDVKIV